MFVTNFCHRAIRGPLIIARFLVAENGVGLYVGGLYTNIYGIPLGAWFGGAAVRTSELRLLVVSSIPSNDIARL